LDWTPVSQFVHLYVNEIYMGVYQLTDERDLGPGRLTTVVDEDPEISEFVLEWDARASADGARRYYDYVRVNNTLFDIRFPSGSRFRSVEQGEYVQHFLYGVDTAIRSRDFDRVSELIDMNSFVDYYIVQELMKNLDIHWSSIFMQIRGQGEERRLHMGPVWDFDLSSGNANADLPPRLRPLIEDYYPTNAPEGFHAALVNYWFRYLMAIPEFHEAVRVRFNYVKDVEIAQMIDAIRYLAINFEDEFLRNFERHDILGQRSWRATPAMNEIETFRGHVDYLINFLTQRVDWLYEALNSDSFNTYVVPRFIVIP